MTTWATRELDNDERVRLATRADAMQRRSDLISQIAHFGLYIVLIPMLGAGVVASLLAAASVSEGTAFLVGAIAGVLVALAVFIPAHRRRTRDHAATKDIAASLRAVRIGRSITVQPQMAWEITADPDEPAYLLRIGGDQFLYLNVRGLPAGWQPCSTMTVTALEDPPAIVGVTCEGTSIRVDNTLAKAYFGVLVDPHIECEILGFSDLPRDWQLSCGAA